MKNYAKTASKLAVVFVGLMSFSVANAAPPRAYIDGVPTRGEITPRICTATTLVGHCNEQPTRQCSTKYHTLTGNYYQCKTDEKGQCTIGTFCHMK
jgi:hypothetical protein